MRHAGRQTAPTQERLPRGIGGLATALLGVALGLQRRELALGLAITLSVMVTGYMLIVHAALR